MDMLLAHGKNALNHVSQGKILTHAKSETETYSKIITRTSRWIHVKAYFIAAFHRNSTDTSAFEALQNECMSEYALLISENEGVRNHHD